MRRWILSGLLAVSCTQMPLFPGPPRSRTEVGGHRPAEGWADGNEQAESHIYLTALVYPPGYDWQRDTAQPKAVPELLLLRDGEAWMRTTLLDGSVHRFQAGALWEIGLAGGETVLRRDGELYARWAGEEALRGFLVEEDGVYTLGQRIGGPGVRLRRDGELLFSDDKGVVLGSMDESGWKGGALARDGDGLYYGYSIRLGETQREFRFMDRDACVSLLPAGSWREIFDARHFGGVLYRTEVTPEGRLCLVAGEQRITFPINQVPRLAKLLPWKDGVLVFGYDGTTAWTRAESTFIRHYAQNRVFQDCYTDGDKYAFIQTDASGRVESFYYAHSPDEEVFLGGDYRLMAPVAGCMEKGHLAVGLTNLDGEEHLLCLDELAVPLYFNGYITSVSIE